MAKLVVHGSADTGYEECHEVTDFTVTYQISLMIKVH